jgi:hypothetical protein
MNLQRRPVVTDADVEHVVKEDILRGANPLGEEHFDNLIDDGDSSPEAFKHLHIRKILAAIARHTPTQDSSACPLAWITPDGVPPEFIRAILDDLEHRDVITRDKSGCYKIRVGLFREWLNLNG